MSEHNGSSGANGKLRTRSGIGVTLLGFLLFLLGASPEVFGADRSQVIGFVQIVVFEFGLGIMCLGGYFALTSLWNGLQKSIAADLGVRLAATGYVIALASGMADVFGLGTRPLPNIPFFGYWQARGVLIGEAVIIVGFLLIIPWRAGQEPKPETPPIDVTQ